MSLSPKQVRLLQFAERVLLILARDPGNPMDDIRNAAKDVAPLHTGHHIDYGARLRIYDNSSASGVRYTMLPPRNAGARYVDRYKPAGPVWMALEASAKPFRLMGIGLTTSAMAGPHLGKRTHWFLLPPDVRKFARQTFPEFCPEEP